MNSKVFCLDQTTSIANQFIAEMRDIETQKDPARFRRNIYRLGQLLAYELSKHLSYKETEVETPLGSADVQVLDSSLVLATILRAGLPLHQSFLDFFEHAENAFIASYRRHHRDGSFEIAMEYATYPSIDEKVIVITDAMLATGSSIEHAIEEFMEQGKPKEIHVVTIIAARQGLEHLARLYPSVFFWSAAIDEELTARSYIVPGLGDAGDLCYGSKRQE